MYNIYKGREFKYSFEELYSDYEGSGRHTGEQLERLKNIWSYFEEGTNEKEIKLLMGVPDRRTRDGKWVSAMRAKHGLHDPLSYGHKYIQFTRREQRFIEAHT